MAQRRRPHAINGGEIMNMRTVLTAPDFQLLFRLRVEDANRNSRDIVGAAFDAFHEYEARISPLVPTLLGEIKRIEIRPGTETLYTFLMEHGLFTALFELNHKDVVEGSKAFTERYLQHFHVLITWKKGEWSMFIDGLLNMEETRRIIHPESEMVSDEDMAVEAFVDRVSKWKATSDIHESLREEDHFFYDTDQGVMLVRSERVEGFLKRAGYKIEISKFARVLEQRGYIMRTSFSKKIPSKSENGKPQVLRFWNMRPSSFGFTAADIKPTVSAILPDDPMVDGATALEEPG